MESLDHGEAPLPGDNIEKTQFLASTTAKATCSTVDHCTNFGHSEI